MGGMKDTLGDDLFSVRCLPPPAPAAAAIPDDVRRLFEKITLDVSRAGWKRFSADAILHRIRWYHHIERGDRSFKCNNNWTAVLARWFIERHPEMHGFFELRASPNGKSGER